MQKRLVHSVIHVIVLSTLCGCTSHPNKNVSLVRAYQIAPHSKLVSASSAEGYYLLGQQYQRQHNDDLAITAYQKALKLEASNLRYLKGLASAYANKKQYALAIERFTQISTLEPNAANLNNLGYAYFLAGKYQLAEANINAALKLDANYLVAQQNMANILEKSSLESAAQAVKNQVVNNQLESNLGSAPTNEIDTAEGKQPPAPQAIKSNDYTLIVNQLQKQIDDIKQQLSNATLTQQEANSFPVELRVSELEAKLNHIKQEVKLVKSASGMFDVSYASNIAKQISADYSGLPYHSNTHQAVVNFKYDNRYGYVEILNGNGVKGLAKKVRNQLIEQKIVSNILVKDAAHYAYRKTIIEYRAGYADMASELASSLLVNPEVKISWNLPSKVSVRTTIGKNFNG